MTEKKLPPSGDKKSTAVKFSHERRYSMVNMAILAPKLVGKAVGKKAAGLGAVFIYWFDIAGAEIAKECRPKKLDKGRSMGGGKPPVTLILEASSAAIPQLQMQLPMLLQRVNAYFGFQAITQIKLVHGVIEEDNRPQWPTTWEEKAPTYTGKTTALLTNLAPNLPDELQQAFQRLGNAVLAREKGQK
ncbi:MAG: DUF721 domain-containing protein [Alphaproteobacteria bacterium]